jgi:hypothetical protein
MIQKIPLDHWQAKVILTSLVVIVGVWWVSW